MRRAAAEVLALPENGPACVPEWLVTDLAAGRGSTPSAAGPTWNSQRPMRLRQSIMHDPDGHLPRFRPGLGADGIAGQAAHAVEASAADGGGDVPDGARGFLDVVIGPPAEIGGMDRRFDDLREAPPQLKIMLLRKIASGDLLVLDAGGGLAWSNATGRHQHGLAPVIPP